MKISRVILNWGNNSVAQAKERKVNIKRGLTYS